MSAISGQEPMKSIPKNKAIFYTNRTQNEKGQLKIELEKYFPCPARSGTIIKYNELPAHIIEFIENVGTTSNKFFRKIKVKKFVLRGISISFFRGKMQISLYLKIHKDMGQETYHLYRISDHENRYAGEGCVGETISINGNLSEQTPIFDLNYYENKSEDFYNNRKIKTNL